MVSVRFQRPVQQYIHICIQCEFVNNQFNFRSKDDTPAPRFSMDRKQEEKILDSFKDNVVHRIQEQVGYDTGHRIWEQVGYRIQEQVGYKI